MTPARNNRLPPTLRRPTHGPRPKQSANRSGWPWLLGGGGIIAAFAALLFGASKSQEVENLQARLADEQQLNEKLKNLPVPAAGPRLAELSRERDQLREQLREVNAGLARSALESEQLRQRVEQLGLAQQQLLDQAAPTADGADASQTELDALRQERDQLRQTLTVNADNLTALGERLTNLEQTSAAAEQRVTALQQDLDQQTKTLAELRQQLEQTSAERDQLNAALADARSETEQAIADRDTLRERLLELESGPPGQAADSRVADLRERLRQTQSDADSATAVLQQVAQKLALDATAQDWAKPASNGSFPLISKLDQALAQTVALKPSQNQGGYINSIARGAGLQAALAELRPQRARNPSLKPDEVKLHELHFSPGSARLAPGAERKAKEVAALFERDVLQNIKILGFSDTTGNAQANLRLSQKRADAVAALLTAAGVPHERIEVIAKGENDLPEKTPDGVDEPLNRCVGIFATPTVE